MKAGTMAAALAAGLAVASMPLPAATSAAKASECTPAGDCTHYRHLVTYPVSALSYDSGAFATHPQGLNWPDNTGTATLTVHRPPDFNGDKVRLTFVYELLDPAPGTILFAVIPISFHHGSGFETYGGFLSDTVDSPESPTTLLQQSVVVEPGEGWNPNAGPWWYFEIGRQGSFNAGLRLMAVTLEY